MIIFKLLLNYLPYFRLLLHFLNKCGVKTLYVSVFTDFPVG